MVILNNRMNQNGRYIRLARKIISIFFLNRIIPNIVKNATSDLSKSVLASLVFLKDDQSYEDSR